MCNKAEFKDPPTSRWRVLMQDLWSIVVWFSNLFLPTLKGRPACKPTMPTVIPTVIEELSAVMRESGKAVWSFVDLGCGQGTMLRPMREATLNGQPMFERVLGVELDPGTHREAVNATWRDDKIEVICGDMFPFVEKACGGANILGGSAAFYVYEPLWMANLTKAETDALYSRMLANVAKHSGSIVVYCCADSAREIPTSLFEASGMVLKRATSVAQNGVFNKLRGRFNPLEVWQVP